jgi:hypothetical protein
LPDEVTRSGSARPDSGETFQQLGRYPARENLTWQAGTRQVIGTGILRDPSGRLLIGRYPGHRPGMSSTD